MFSENITRTLFCDVAVIGGGTGGCAAAIEAARKGARTMLFEKGVSLGGLATNGYVPTTAGNVEGICKEFVQRLEAIGQLENKSKFPDDYHNPVFEPEYGKIVLEDMVYEAGVRLVYSSTLVYVETENNLITRAIFYTSGGYMAVRAKIYIDATGDGDVSALAGVPYEVGGQEFAGLNIASTLGSRWANVNLTKFYQAEREYNEKMATQGIENPKKFIMALEEQAIERGELARKVGGRNGFFLLRLPNTPEDDADIVTFSFQSYYCHSTDAIDVTRQVLEQHQLMKQFHAFVRKYVPGYENARLVGMGNIPGTRESRRIFGEYMLKSADVACGTKFDDGIARFPEMFDTHHPTSEEWFFIRHVHIPAPAGSAVCEDEHIGQDCDARMHPFGVPAGIPARANPRDYCEIPYRCLLPQNVDNLLCAGRCCSAEFHANGAMRIIGPAMGTGMAAGLAASVAFERGIRPRDIDGTELRRMMIEDEGVPLDQPTSGHWQMLREKEGAYVINVGDAITIK